MSLTVKAYLKRCENANPEIRRFTVDHDVTSNYEYLSKKVAQVFPSLGRPEKFTLAWKGKNYFHSVSRLVMTQQFCVHSGRPETLIIATVQTDEVLSFFVFYTRLGWAQIWAVKTKLASQRIFLIMHISSKVLILFQYSSKHSLVRRTSPPKRRTVVRS